MKCTCKLPKCTICSPPLIATFTSTTEQCKCLQSISFGLNWNGYEWYGNFQINEIEYNFILSFYENCWSILGSNSNNGSFFQFKINALSNNPFSLYFNNIQQVDFCEGQFQIYVTS